jgi:hydrogenase large subunit
MATITIDPVNRIEGHLKVEVVESAGVVTDAKCTGTLFRGFELILNRRDPRDAPVLTQRICGVCPTSHGSASVNCLDTAIGNITDPGTHNATTGNMDSGYVNTLPANGRIIRNIILGMDTIMSHITHLYHLSALDFIDGSVLNVPWSPTYTAGLDPGLTMLPATGVDTNTVTNRLVSNYVEALAIRRKCHTAGALFSGRQPIQHAMVPGGVTTLFTNAYPLATGSTDAADLTGYDKGGPYNATQTRSKFKSLLTTIRTFINTKYIPDVVTVANVFSQYWNVGTGCKALLSYGDYPIDSAGRLVSKRGVVQTTGALGTFDQANVREYVAYSYYNYAFLSGTNLHPFDGETTPDMVGDGYSWLKAPRLIIPEVSATVPQVVEVGPLARMILSHTYGTASQISANDTVTGGTSLGQALSGPSLGYYSVTGLITTALGLCTAAGGATGLTLLPKLFSPLGRHACRALEAKYLADLIAGGCDGGASWVDQLDPTQPSYTYRKIPKQIATGYGLTEAPRGSLGHWIKIEGRKIAKYQCVVPSTWNFSPAHAATTSGSKTNRGPVEQSLMDTFIGTTPTQQIVNILRVVHPFDCCIACAVHVVSPEGKEKLRFAIGADGRPTNIEKVEE